MDLGSERRTAWPQPAPAARRFAQTERRESRSSPQTASTLPPASYVMLGGPLRLRPRWLRSSMEASGPQPPSGVYLRTVTLSPWQLSVARSSIQMAENSPSGPAARALPQLYDRYSQRSQVRDSGSVQPCRG